MKLRQDTTYQKGSIVRHSKIAPPMTAMGHSRPIDKPRTVAACPLRALKADKWAGVSLSPLSAMSGCEQSQQASPYSITSSALASSLDGTVRPSAQAVLRLINR